MWWPWENNRKNGKLCIPPPPGHLLITFPVETLESWAWGLKSNSCEALSCRMSKDASYDTRFFTFNIAWESLRILAIFPMEKPGQFGVAAVGKTSYEILFLLSEKNFVFWSISLFQVYQMKKYEDFWGALKKNPEYCRHIQYFQKKIV